MFRKCLACFDFCCFLFSTAGCGWGAWLFVSFVHFFCVSCQAIKTFWTALTTPASWVQLRTQAVTELSGQNMDPAETEHLKQAISNQGAMLGQHDATLKLMMDNLQRLATSMTQLGGTSCFLPVSDKSCTCAVPITHLWEKGTAYEQVACWGQGPPFQTNSTIL